MGHTTHEIADRLNVIRVKRRRACINALLGVLETIHRQLAAAQRQASNADGGLGDADAMLDEFGDDEPTPEELEEFERRLEAEDGGSSGDGDANLEDPLDELMQFGSAYEAASTVLDGPMNYAAYTLVGEAVVELYSLLLKARQPPDELNAAIENLETLDENDGGLNFDEFEDSTPRV